MLPVVVSRDSIGASSGHRIPMGLFMGIPVLDAQVGDDSHSMFFDTGAQISASSINR